MSCFPVEGLPHGCEVVSSQWSRLLTVGCLAQQVCTEGFPTQLFRCLSQQKVEGKEDNNISCVNERVERLLFAYPPPDVYSEVVFIHFRGSSDMGRLF